MRNFIKSHSDIVEAWRVIEDNRQIRMSGGYNSIPFGFRRLQRCIPGLRKRKYIILTASSGIGKSKMSKVIFAWKPYDFVRSHPALGMKLHTIYFLLEESKPGFIWSLIAYKLRQVYGIRLDVGHLISESDPDNPSAVLSDDLKRKVDTLRPYIEEFRNHITLVDDVRHPYGIFKTCTDYLHKIGDFTRKPMEFVDNSTGFRETRMVRDRFYFGDDPENEDNHQYVQVIIDNMNRLAPQKGQDLHEAMRSMSSDYLVELRNRYGCAILAIQQQSGEKEKQQYTYKGMSIESKLEPSLDGLGDCKLTQRDADEVYGLFAPNRYEITTHRGYDIKLLEDNYRSWSFLKGRDIKSDLRLGFLFDGASNYVTELPRATSMTPTDYGKALSLCGRSVT